MVSLTALPSSTIDEGAGATTRVSDEDVFCVLETILKELKIMNIHLQSITGEKIMRADTSG